MDICVLCEHTEQGILAVIIVGEISIRGFVCFKCFQEQEEKSELGTVMFNKRFDEYCTIHNLLVDEENPLPEEHQQPCFDYATGKGVL